MDLKNMLNKGKEYASKVKDNINKSLEESNQRKAILEEKLAKANSLTKENKELIKVETLNSDQQVLYDYLLKECKMQANENINSLIALIVFKGETILANTTLTDKTNLETYNFVLTDKNVYLVKESSYIIWPYTSIDKVEILSKGVMSSIISINTYVLAIPSNVLDSIILFLTKEENRNQWKINVQNNFLEYKKQLHDDNSSIGMEQKVLKNDLQINKNSTWLRNNFALIANRLQDNEKVLYPFVGMLNYRTNTDTGDYYAFALTTNRLLYASQGIMGDNFYAIPKEQITGITMNTTALNGVITVHTTVKNVIIGVMPEKAIIICNNLKEKLNSSDDSKNSNSTSLADELLKLKKLFDSGVINEEEYEKGKAKLLG